MKEQLAAFLNDYAHQRGGGPVDLTNPAVAAELAEALTAFRPADDEGDEE